MASADLQLKEVHLLRGWDFQDGGDEYCNITYEDDAELGQGPLAHVVGGDGVVLLGAGRRGHRSLRLPRLGVVAAGLPGALRRGT